MDSAVPRKRSKLSLARAKRAGNLEDNNEIEDVAENNEPKTQAVIDSEASLQREQVQDSRGKAPTSPYQPKSSATFLASKRTINQPYRPLPPMKLKVMETLPDEEGTKHKIVTKEENGYKPLPKRVMKVWKRAPKKLEHNLFGLPEDELNLPYYVDDQRDAMELNCNSKINTCKVDVNSVENSPKNHTSLNKKANERLPYTARGILATMSDTNSRNEECVKNKIQETGENLTSSSHVEAACFDDTKFLESLNYCPLCQAPFDIGTSQLDQDSHIAACLAMSNEDVMW